MTTPDIEIAPFTLRLLGDFEARIGGRAMPKTRTRKERWLLALLVLGKGREIARASLAQTLWPFPDHPVDLAAYNLRRSLSDLRKALGTQAARLESPTPQTLRFSLEGMLVDVLEFDRLAASDATDDLTIALDLYQGLLLPDCTEPWAATERERRHQAYLQILETLARRSMLEGDPRGAERYLRLAVAADPLRESAQLALMETLAVSGDCPSAMQVYQQYCRTLQRERSALPGKEITTAFHRIRREVTGRPQTVPVTGEQEAPGSGGALPAPLTSLIGRDEQVRGVAERLHGTRLLTLTGAGGVGKTRLAIQVAERVAAQFGDGVRFVDLGRLSDPNLVPQAIAAAVGAREEQGRPLLESVAAALKGRSLLLILDSCEHLIGASALAAERLLQGSRELQILATSRQPLGVSGEALWRVPSLSLPDPRRLPARGEDLPSFLLDYAAIRLLVERASLVQPDFALTAENARAVTQICTRLDGIPLAIELAAARVQAMPVEQIARRFHQLFRLLTGGPRTSVSRQQTLEATIRWSYDLLSEPEQQLLSRLSVFAGGWTLDAAEAVCRDALSPEARADDGELLDLLAQLVDKSLVLYDDQFGAERYRFLETVREYGRYRLEEAGRIAEIGERHAQFYARLAEEAGPKLFGPEAVLWMQRLQAEHENLRAALAWSLESEERLPYALQLAESLWRFWYRRSYLSEGRAWLDAVLAKPAGSEHVVLRARAAIGAGFLAFHQGDVEAARRWFNGSLEVGRQQGDLDLTASALHNLGYMAWYWNRAEEARLCFEEEVVLRRTLGDLRPLAEVLNHLGILASDSGERAQAELYFEESLRIAREIGDLALTASTLHSRAHMAYQGHDYESARSLYREVLELGKQLGDATRVATALHRLGLVSHAAGDYSDAQIHFEESLAVGRGLEDRRFISAALHSLGVALREKGDYGAAFGPLVECLTNFHQEGDGRGIIATLEALCGLAVAERQAVRAAVLFGAAEAARTALLHGPGQSTEDGAEIAALRAASNAEEFDAHREQGRRMKVGEAIAYALRRSE